MNTNKVRYLRREIILRYLRSGYTPKSIRYIVDGVKHEERQVYGAELKQYTPKKH